MARRWPGDGAYLASGANAPHLVIGNNGSWSMACWVFFNGAQSPATGLMTHGLTGSQLPMVLAIGGSGMGVSGQVSGAWYSGGWVSSVFDPDVPVLGRWMHYALLRGPITGKLYKNGKLVSYSNGWGSANPTAMNTPFRLGRRWDSAEVLNGAMQDAAIWMDRELQQWEIDLLAMGVPPHRAAPVGLTHYWPISRRGTELDLGSHPTKLDMVETAGSVTLSPAPGPIRPSGQLIVAGEVMTGPPPPGPVVPPEPEPEPEPPPVYEEPPDGDVLAGMLVLST